jgi:hypothetical protein
MAGITFETGRTRLKELIEGAPDTERLRNEAATRLQLIDRLLFDCLGWNRDDAEVEDHESGRYADYVLDRRIRLLIIEAKREGVAFELPEDLSRVTQLEVLYGVSDALTEALDQVMRYAQDRGTPYAAVCNGHQLVALLATRTDGIAPRAGNALVFDSLQAMLDDFPAFWDGLSRQGCSTRRLNRALGSPTAARTPPRLSEGIPNFPGTLTLDSRELTLTTLSGLFLPDFVRGDKNEEEFLSECYAAPGAHSHLSLLSQSLLQTRYSTALGEELGISLEGAQTKRGLNQALLDEVAVTAAGKEPVILLGSVGVGKTMFLRRLLRIEAKDLAEKAVILYINLGRNAVFDAVRPHISRSLPEQLRERYGVDIDSDEFLRGTYHGDLRRFAKGVNAPLASSDSAEFKRREIDHLRELTRNKEEHLGRSLEHLVKLRREQVVIVLDNIDQREREDQEEAFLAAQTMAKNWPCTVFLTLRPETFNESRVDGVLKAYQVRAFAVDPPRVERAVAMRLEFGLSHYRKEGRLPQWLGWTAQSDDLREYLEILLKSFRRNGRLQAALVNLSGGNTRRALELMETFVNSPHSDAIAIVDRNRRGGQDLVIPHHLFLRAVLLGDGEYFDPSKARIPNLFAIGGQESREHFLLPCVLGLLRHRLENRDREGYTPVEDVYDSFQNLGFDPSHLNDALDRAIYGDLIEQLPPSGAPRALRLTSVGAYACETMAGEFQYLDVVVTDTPVIDPAVREKLRLVKSTRPRLERAEVFLSYLDNAWEGSGLADTELFDWPTHAATARQEIEDIANRL